MRADLHCKNCGHALGDEPSDRCPECGTEFDPDVVDTVPAPRTYASHLHHRARRFWLFACLGSWGLVLVMGVLVAFGILDPDEPVFDSDLVAMIGVVCVLSVPVTGLGFIISLFLKRGRSRLTSISPVLSLTEARRALSDAIGKEDAWSDAAEYSATELARALLATGVHEQGVISELRRAGLSRHGAGQIFLAAYEPETPSDSVEDRGDASTPGERQTVRSAEDALTCPHCAEPIDRLDHFCPSCTNPVTAHASMDPLGQVYAVGRAYYHAVSGRTRLIIVLGMWLIFGPQIPLLLFGAYTVVSDLVAPASRSQLGNALTFLLILALLALYAAILWQVTKHYQESRRAAERYSLELCAQCGYDLRGTIAAGRNVCPECGVARDDETS